MRSDISLSFPQEENKETKPSKTKISLSLNPYFELLNAAYTGNLDRFKSKKTNRYGSGSLHAAAKGGSLNVCEYLLDTLKFDVDAKDYYAITPLYHAIFEGGLDTVRYLLEKGANADSLEDEVFPPLHSAARIGDTKMITLLLSRGARVDVATREGTALREAACNGQRDAVKVLLDHGANPNLATRECMHRPLISAISVKSWECVELLLQAGADPNAVPHGHSSPLALVAEDGRVDVIKLLLEAGADPNYKTN
ncbi:hypothetical protein MKW94_000997, partial [Papaver nudicaule]|nr:hypothetical protein [Papaver nudicaule]